MGNKVRALYVPAMHVFIGKEDFNPDAEIIERIEDIHKIVESINIYTCKPGDTWKQGVVYEEGRDFFIECIIPLYDTWKDKTYEQYIESKDYTGEPASREEFQKWQTIYVVPVEVQVDDNVWLEVADLAFAARNKGMKPCEWITLCKVMGYSVTRVKKK